MTDQRVTVSELKLQELLEALRDPVFTEAIAWPIPSLRHGFPLPPYTID
jgi:hypothetical protein